MLNMNTSETLFFHPLLLSGISSIIIFEIRNRLVLLKNKSLNLSDQVPIARLMCIILMELNLREHKFRHNFQDTLDQFCNCGRYIETTIHFFSTAQINQIKEKLFLKKLVTSNVLC